MIWAECSEIHLVSPMSAVLLAAELFGQWSQVVDVEISYFHKSTEATIASRSHSHVPTSDVSAILAQR